MTVVVEKRRTLAVSVVKANSPTRCRLRRLVPRPWPPTNG